jgi:hypothetical protein
MIRILFYFISKSGEFVPIFSMKNPLFKSKSYFSGQNLMKFHPQKTKILLPVFQFCISVLQVLGSFFSLGIPCQWETIGPCKPEDAITQSIKGCPNPVVY